MTKDQFVQSRVEFMRRDRRFNTVYLVLLFAVLLAAIPLSDYVPKAYDTQFALAYLILLCINAAAMLWRGRNQAKRAGLVCNSCQGGLLGTPGNIAAATGQCPHCGQRAFAGDA